MKYIFLIICSFILPFCVSKEMKTRLCIDCKYFTKDFLNNNKFGKCSLFPIEEYNKCFLVDRVNIQNIRYSFCSIARSRDDMCGEKGKLFIKK
jgi:hypothetical protein